MLPLLHRTLLASLFLLPLWGCSSTPNENPGASLNEQDNGFAYDVQAAAPAPTLPERQEISDKVAEEDSKMEAAAAETPAPVGKTDRTDIRQHPSLRVEMNDRVNAWIEFFTGRGRERFDRFLKRGARYKATIKNILKENGIPEEFYYLALIESGFTTNATSRASAVGVWQFIRGTAVRYGLQCNAQVDERRDVVRSTRAAAAYLRDLFNVFGSWRLAMASYNAGEMKIFRAIINGKSRDFWTLAEKRRLPSETMDYVPKFFAATIIGRNPKKYGFELDDEKNVESFRSAHVPAGVSLSRVAKATGVDLERLKEINPHLLRGRTPSGGSTYELWMPNSDDFDTLVVAARRLEPDAPVFTRAAPKPRLMRVADTTDSRVRRVRVHKVRPGETLKRIATKYKVPIAKIKKLNKLASLTIYPGQLIRLDPSRRL